MDDRNRYRRSHPQEQEQDRAQRQAGFLTFQVLMVALLLLAVWGMKALRLPAFFEVQRLCALLKEDNDSIRTIIGYAPVAKLIEERFSIVLPELPEWLPLPPPSTDVPDQPDEGGAPFPEGGAPESSVAPAPESAAESGANPPANLSSAEGAGGVYPGLLLAGGQPQRPRSVSFSPVLLTAQPRVPVSGRVSSGFGWRENPLSPGPADFHTGLDIAAAEGTPILAALPGAVADTGYSDSYGNFIHIAHAGGLETHYAHCSAILAKTGENIRQGERIALVGSTGNVTGPHLHFELRQDGLCFDPLAQLLFAG